MTTLETRLDRALRRESQRCTLCGRRRGATEGYECARCRKAWGIQFTPAMVAAILAGEKTVTRRVNTARWLTRRPGDVLWVRRTRYARRANAPACLTVLTVRRERLHSITDDEIRREGLACRPTFKALWERLHGVDAWDQNPEVARIEFKVDPV